VQAEYLPVIKAKQRTAFPPNYVHSLDSAHMMLTAIACNKAGARAPHVHAAAAGLRRNGPDACVRAQE
jgi:DNA-directed RNA polymerase